MIIACILDLTTFSENKKTEKTGGKRTLEPTECHVSVWKFANSLSTSGVAELTAISVSSNASFITVLDDWGLKGCLPR